MWCACLSAGKCDLEKVDDKMNSNNYKQSSYIFQAAFRYIEDLSRLYFQLLNLNEQKIGLKYKIDTITWSKS